MNYSWKRLSAITVLFAVSLTGCSADLLDEKSPRDHWKKSYDEGYVLQERRDFKKAESKYQKALKKLGNSSKYKQERAKTLVALTQVLIEEEKFDQAESCIDKAQPLCESLWKPDKGGELNRSNALLYVQLLSQKTKVLLHKKKLKEALGTINSAYSKSRTMLAPDHTIHQIMLLKVSILDMQGKQNEAEELRKNASLLAAPLHYKDPSFKKNKSPEALCQAAREAVESTRYKQAGSYLSMYLPALEKESKIETRGLLGESYLLRGTVKVKENSLEEAEKDFRRAIEVLKNTPGLRNKKHMFDAYEALVILKLNDEKPETAEKIALKALELNKIVEHSRGKDRFDSEILNLLARIRIKQGRLDEAETAYKKRLDIEYQIKREKNSRYADTLEDLASLYDLKGEVKNARATFKRAIKRRERESSTNPVFLQEVHEAYAEFLSRHGFDKEAKVQHNRAIQLRDSITGPLE